MRAQTCQLMTALAAYILLCCLLLGRPVTAQQQSIPTCSELHLRIRASRATVVPGGSVVFKAKLANKGARTLSGVGVRLDLPTGLVAKGQPSGTPIVVDATAYWTGLTLKPGRRRILKLKARACGAATAGNFRLGGAVYVVNATDTVTCLSPMMRAKPSTVRGEEGRALRFEIDQNYTHLAPPSHTGVPCLQIRINAAKTWGGTSNKGPVCSTPAPTPVDGPGYTLYSPSQRLLDGTLVGYTNASGRRRLTTGSDASACQALCSGAGFEPIFYFSVQSTGEGACYCSQDK